MEKRLQEVTKPEELEFYSIEPDGQGGKQIHMLGFTYDSGSDNGNGTWRAVEPCGVIVPIAEFIEGVRADEDGGYAYDLMCEAKQYEGDYTEEGIVEYINHFFDGHAANCRLSYGEITEDTPCGDYVC